MTNDHTEFDASWQGAAVNPAAVERELSRMLRDLTEPDDAAGAQPHARASVLNLIVHTGAGVNDQRAIDALKDLADNHPTRTLVIAVDPSATESGLDASATAHCHLRPGLRGRVCYEEARLVARGELAHHLGSIVEPLLVADLPVMLWWLDGVPAPDDELMALSDRLILRSRELAESDLPRLARLVRELGAGLTVGDLTWGALMPWRDLLAQLFDPPAARPYLRQITRVGMRYVEGGTPWEALLMVGWLAARLGWTMPPDGAATPAKTAIASAGRSRSRGEVTSPLQIPDSAVSSAQVAEGSSEVQGLTAALDLLSPSGPVTITLESIGPAEGLVAGGLAGVSLEAKVADDTASFEVERMADGSCALQRCTRSGECTVDRALRFTTPSLASLIGHELNLAERDAVYEASLEIAASLVG